MNAEAVVSKIQDLLCGFFSAIYAWIKTPEGISAVVLVITLIFLILTFQYAYRPYVGVTEVNSNYDNSTKDLIAYLKIKNTGNIPANNIQTNVEMIHNSKTIGKVEGASRFVLFPSQETSGNPAFHHVEESNLQSDKLDIRVTIIYELPIRFLIRIYTRKFKTEELLRYDYRTKKFSIIAGESI